MSEMTQGDRFLLEQIRQGNADGWAQLVGRYQGRLLAFARAQLSDAHAAEDAVQDTFMGFIKALATFREQSSLESYLFVILRHRIIDHYRRRQIHACSLQDQLAGTAGDGSAAPAELGQAIAGSDPTASWYVRRDEAHEQVQQKLWAALRDLVEQLKKSLNFRKLQVAEMLFYAQLKNREIAAHLGMDEKQIALIKHRFLKRLAGYVAADDDASGPTVEDSMYQTVVRQEALLTRIWEERRPSCPKRSSIGAFLLDTLDGPWHDYIDFHLHQLGCRFCRANLADLKEQDADTRRQVDRMRTRIAQSTVGFLRQRDR